MPKCAEENSVFHECISFHIIQILFSAQFISLYYIIGLALAFVSRMIIFIELLSFLLHVAPIVFLYIFCSPMSRFSNYSFPLVCPFNPFCFQLKLFLHILLVSIINLYTFLFISVCGFALFFYVLLLWSLQWWYIVFPFLSLFVNFQISASNEQHDNLKLFLIYFLIIYVVTSLQLFITSLHLPPSLSLVSLSLIISPVFIP